MGDNGKNGNGRLYHVYRDTAGGDLAALIGPALADHHDRYGCLPPALAVHKSAVGKAREVLDGLEVALEVFRCGGTLVGECWLQVGENGHRRPVSPTTAPDAIAGLQDAQRSNGGAAAQADVTPERARPLVQLPLQKQCSKCQEWKFTDEFWNMSASTDGKNSKCKDCARRRWDSDSRICLNCSSEFVPTQPNQMYCCPQCCGEYHEKQIRQVGRLLILDRDEFRCIYCGTSSVEDATQLHVDHVIPRAGGGEDTAGNLVTACTRCNLEKAARALGEKGAARILAEVARRNSKHGIEPQLTIKV